MVKQARPTPLSGADVVARTPRVFTYLAAVLAAQQGGDGGYEVEAPTDLPLDEATFTCMVVVMADMADSLGLTPDQLRAMAEQAADAYGSAAQAMTADPAQDPDTAPATPGAEQ